MRGAEPIRVLLVSPSFGDYGGIEAFVFAVAASLRENRRFDVRICFKRVAAFRLRDSLERYCSANGVTFCDRASAGYCSRGATAHQPTGVPLS